MAESTPQKSENLSFGHDYWNEQISLALEDPDYKKFVDQGKKITDRFLDKRDTGSNESTHLNLFHSNVTTLRSMLYGQSPKVNAERRYEDETDDVARVGTDILERLLNNDIGLRTDTYSFALRRGLDDFLIVGLGQARVRYEAKLAEDGSLASESAPTDYVYWEDFLWSPARSWDEVRWVAFRTYMTEEEAKSRFKEKAAGLQYESRKLNEGEGDKADVNKMAQIWEIWDKKTKTVYWFSKGSDKLLDAKPDTLKLSGFYPCPQPMMANLTNTKLVPKADYIFAQDLYNEIDNLETRIVTLTTAVKVVGVYDKSSEGVQRMLKEGVENDLIPVDNWAMFAEKGGLKGQVDWLPIEAVVAAIEKLRAYRDEAINLLYQVTGMSDILRGQSTQSRTSATEQELKAKFASVRIQFMQDAFAHFASELQSLKAEIISVHYNPQTILNQSNIKFDDVDQQFVNPAIGLIKSKSQLIWRVKVRPESIAMVDYAQLKAERTEYIMALSQFMQSAAPIIQQEPTSLPYLLRLLQWGLAGFKGSQQIEGVMDQAIAAATQSAQQPKPDANAMKMQLEQQKQQSDLQMKQMEGQLKQQEFAQKMQQDQLKFQQEMQQDQQKFILEMKQLLQKGQIQQQVAEQNAQTKMMTAQVDASVKQQSAVQEAELAASSHEAEQERLDDAAEREMARPTPEAEDD